MSSYKTGDSYELTARFDNIGGLKIRSPVSAGGVRIGRVTDIQYNNESYEAVVSMSIEEKYNQFPIDTAASILTSGLLGEQFIGFELWGRRAIRLGRWKAVHAGVVQGSGGWQLFDVAVDPGETTDLAAQRPNLMKKITAAWSEYAKENGVVLPEGRVRLLPPEPLPRK